MLARRGKAHNRKRITRAHLLFSNTGAGHASSRSDPTEVASGLNKKTFEEEALFQERKEPSLSRGLLKPSFEE
tara:strand:+ start:121 stop:339 length:219 start_codon:yes stop_codon:yes gene_type:complete